MWGAVVQHLPVVATVTGQRGRREADRESNRESNRESGRGPAMRTAPK